ncbi:MAG: hypothetical protein ACM3N9_05840, partial [Syntrophothermus sp.]
MKNFRKKYDFFLFTILAFVAVYLALDRNFPDRTYKGQYEIVSDKSLYYVYLPATFIYHWDVSKFKPGIDEVRGGFSLHHDNNKVIIKMTCGVAILWLPFFLVAHSIALITHQQADGFSLFYEHFAVIPGAIFLVLGLFFLRRFLLRYVNEIISWLTVLLVAAGTNLYFFSIDEGLMSHVHSFFLFSLYLFLLGKYLDHPMRPFRYFVGMCFVVALAVLIRPTNIFAIPWIFLLDADSWKTVKERFIYFLKPRFILTFILILFLVFLPQLIYWKYLTGKFLFYSYGSEKFSLWNKPMLIPFWFAPLNGLFLYSPMVLFFIAGAVWMAIRKKANGWFIIFLFFLLSYVFASWHCWYYGGSFGCRSMIEYYTLFSIGFAFFLKKVFSRKRIIAGILVFGCLAGCVFYNLRMTYYYRWPYFSTWAWDDFKNNLHEARMCHLPKISYHYINDFENSGTQYNPGTTSVYHSATIGGYVDQDRTQNATYYNQMNKMLRNPIRLITLKLWLNQPEGLKNTGVVYKCFVEDVNKQIIF